MPIPALAALAALLFTGVAWMTEIVTVTLFTVTVSLGCVFYKVWQNKPETLFDGKFQPIQDISYGTFLIVCFAGFFFMFLYTAFYVFKNHVLGG